MSDKRYAVALVTLGAPNQVVKDAWQKVIAGNNSLSSIYTLGGYQSALNGAPQSSFTTDLQNTEAMKYISRTLVAVFKDVSDARHALKELESKQMSIDTKMDFQKTIVLGPQELECAFESV